MLTSDSHWVKMSIAGCVREIVRGTNLMPFFFLFLFLYHVLCINQLMGTKTTCSASYGKEKTHPGCFIHPGAGEITINLSSSGTRQTAHQPRKIGNQTQIKRQSQKIK